MELRQLYKKPGVVAVLQHRRTYGLMKAVLNWKPNWKRRLDRPKHRWMEKIIWNSAEIGVQNGKALAQDRPQ